MKYIKTYEVYNFDLPDIKIGDYYKYIQNNPTGVVSLIMKINDIFYDKMVMFEENKLKYNFTILVIEGKTPNSISNYEFGEKMFSDLIDRADVFRYANKKEIEEFNIKVNANKYNL